MGFAELRHTIMNQFLCLIVKYLPKAQGTCVDIDRTVIDILICFLEEQIVYCRTQQMS